MFSSIMTFGIVAFVLAAIIGHVALLQAIVAPSPVEGSRRSVGKASRVEARS